MMRFIGIDTSCYTTSGAVYDADKGLLISERILLTVKKGNRGLSQSEMVYQHVRHIPLIFDKLSPFLTHIEGIGASIFPRRRADSYMPAFLVGKSLGESLSLSLHVPLYGFSHQENHVMAALRLYPFLWGHPFYMMHMSGGTQDVLKVSWNQDEMHIQNLIHSLDITAGQFIDRVGVSLGLGFPCGARLEEMAKRGSGQFIAPVSKIKSSFSFAGPETQVQKVIKENLYTPNDIAFGVLVSIKKSLERVLLQYPFEKGAPFIAVGGVMSNLYLREAIKDICHAKNLTPYFTAPQYSTDNASGNAFGAYMKYFHTIKG